MNHEKIHQAVYDIRRNHPVWPTTFGPCYCGGGKIARGGGRCLDCAQEELAGEVGAEDASTFVRHVAEAASLEREFYLR